MKYPVKDMHIVIKQDCDETEKYAAAELSDYLFKITGHRPSVSFNGGAGSIYLGQVAKEVIAAEVSNDGYRICERDGNLYVYGTVSRGTLYGVYGLLEMWGCKFPDTDTEYVPYNPELSFESGLNVLSEPAFEYRDLYWANTADSTFAAKLRLNGAFGVHTYSEKHGGGIIYAGPKFVHTFDVLLPESEFFETHPEYFSMIDGERVGEHLKTQPCLTNPEVIKIMTDRVFEWLEKEPNAKIVSVSQNDSYFQNSSCNCPECARVNEEEESPAGTLMRFINGLAEKVEKKYPNVIIDTLAYQYSTTPPKLTKPRHNVAIRMCTGGCYSHPITECSENTHTRNCIETWGKHCRRLYIWDYTTDFAQYLIPLPNFRIFQSNARFFKKNGVMGVFEQGNYQGERNGEFCELRSYILAKLLWNPDCDVDELTDGFFDIYYGRGAEYVRKYYNLIHEKTVNVHFAWNPIASDFWSCMSDGDIEDIEAWFAKAKELCSDDARSLMHVCRTEISFRFMLMELKKREFSDEESFAKERESFLDDCLKYNITMYNEGQTTESVR